jgi:alcohol dehydrogenase class IV
LTSEQVTETVCTLTTPGLVFGPGASREVGRRAAGPGITGAPDADDPNPLGGAVRGLMERIGVPARLEEVGYGAADVPELVAGAKKQQRLLACAPLPVDGGLLEQVFRESL